MRVRKETLIITFATTTEAMRMEKFCLEHQIAGRLIPLPPQISAGCGLSWKAEPEQQAAIIKQLTDAGVGWETMQVILH